MTTLITNSQFKQFDANGLPLAAGKIYTYEVGTTTDKVTYQDKEKVAAHTNPVILDSWGEATIWIDGDTKFVVTDSDDVTIRTYPTFSDSGSSQEPVISSPIGAVYRSVDTEIGYIKVRFPMAEWPDTRIMLDVLVYDESTTGSFRLNLSGFARESTAQWENTKSITNGYEGLEINYGNDGSYPAIYIGGIASEWINPQISVVDVFPGQVDYDFATWDSDWEITISTSIGTITSTDTAKKDMWGEWVTIPYSGDWGAAISSPTARQSLVCRKSLDGRNIQVSGSAVFSGTGGNTIATLPAGYRPTYLTTVATGFTVSASDYPACSINTDGTLLAYGSYSTNIVRLEFIFPTD